MNIVEQIRSETKSVLAKTAIVEGETAIDYRTLLARVSVLAGRLAERGIRPGSRIGLRCPDGIDYVVGALALLECGGAVVPIADSLTAQEVQDTIERIDVHGVLIHVEMMDSDAGRAGDRDGGETAESAKTHLDPVDAVFSWKFRSAKDAYEKECREMEAAFIRFSSGTTGESKGVLLSHRSILDRTDAANEGLGISEKDVILWVLGMSHHFVVSILLFLRRGATIIVANRSFPFSVLDAAQRHPITFIYGSAVHYYLLAAADSVPPEALSKVRLAISTAMKMPSEIASAFNAKFGFFPAEAYGIIEVGLPFINTDPSAGQSSVGRAQKAYQLRIDHPDADGVGDVLIKGKGMFDAYFSPWRLREQVLQDGWFATGDLGRVDSDGRLFLRGRTKTVIVCAGMKVFPEEVEETLNAMEGVKESLVFGREHPQYGHVPVAHVVVLPEVRDPEALLGDLRAQCFKRLSSYKVPVEFASVGPLARTPSGKLIRFKGMTGSTGSGATL